LKEYRWRTNRPVKSKGMTPVERKLSDDLKDRFRIYFPTRETVANSKGGLGVSDIAFATIKHLMSILLVQCLR
jgi:hypothetical protein